MSAAGGLNSEEYFPQYLSHPMRYAWFDEDEAAIFLISVGGWFMVSLWWGLAGTALIWFLKVMKERHPRGFLGHWLYTLGVPIFDGYPQSYDTEYYE